jgi:DNA-binding NtrC family response regulator
MSTAAPESTAEFELEPKPPQVQNDQPSSNSNREKPDNQESWTDIERQLIVKTLKEHWGNRTKVAESLGWGRMKLWRKMKKYGLQE